MKLLIRSFWFSASATVAVLAVSLFYRGWAALLPLLILMIIEITFSFDNAVVNAKVLKKMSPLWQRLFLSVGIIIAIFGMRLVFPIVIVALSADLPWRAVLDLALNHPNEYAEKLEIAHPIITSFGGAFLLMLALHFFMTDNKSHHWFDSFEQWLNRRRDWWWLPGLFSLAAVIVISLVPFNHHPRQTLIAGLCGIAAYIAIHGLTIVIGKTTRQTEQLQHYTGGAAFTMFLYLEVLDASFSLDGVLGAFAITSDVLLIVAGLGIGAVWVRSLTVLMVRQGVLEAYRYLEHGAHYAIIVLASAMLVSVFYEVPEFVTGVLGVGFIVAAAIASRRAAVAAE